MAEYETREALPPQLRAISDTLDKWLSRMHGTISSWQSPDCFLRWLEERGWTVVEKTRIEELEGGLEAAVKTVALAIGDRTHGAMASECQQWRETLELAALAGKDKTMDKPTGLYKKYNVSKADGSPSDPRAEYLVLRLDRGEYVVSCRHAALAFASHVGSLNPLLAEDIREWVAALAGKTDEGHAKGG